MGQSGDLAHAVAKVRRQLAVSDKRLIRPPGPLSTSVRPVEVATSSDM